MRSIGPHFDEHNSATACIVRKYTTDAQAFVHPHAYANDSQDHREWFRGERCAVSADVCQKVARSPTRMHDPQTRASLQSRMFGAVYKLPSDLEAESGQPHPSKLIFVSGFLQPLQSANFLDYCESDGLTFEFLVSYAGLIFILGLHLIFTYVDSLPSCASGPSCVKYISY